jgi:glycosyltransferase involved in cell wall biosynthesis
MNRAMSAPNLDLVLFPTIYSFVPVFSRAKKIVMIHDVIAETFPNLTVPRIAARILWKAKVAMGRWQADAIVTVSEYSRKGILEHFGLPPERVSIVGEACDSIFGVLENPRPTDRLQSLGIVKGQRYIVYVGGFSPHKNLESLVAAFAKVSHESDVRLVMVGEHEKEVFHSYFETIIQRVEDLGLTERVVFTGYLPDAELVVLLNLSTVLVLPSLMEGFGLPAIEAVACGCPVIATSASPLPTLLGESAVYVDPTRPEQLHRALASVLASEVLQQKMRATGRETVTRFTWEIAAEQMMRVIYRVAMQ